MARNVSVFFSERGACKMKITSSIRILVVLSILGCPRLSAQESDRSKLPARGEASFSSWVDVYSNIAAKYDFRLQKSSEELKFHPRAVHTYSHPSGLRGTHGAFFVWTSRGRPAVVGSIWSYEVDGGRRNLAHEFDSFAESPLAATKVGGAAWTPQTVIQPQPIPNAPVPTALPRLRLAQMRQLAKQFTGFSHNMGEEVRLRLLPQPLYYSKSDDSEMTDCALFCMFADWDPEIVLLIEARATDAGPRWHYSAARFNICPMRLEYRGKHIWDQGQAPQTTYTFGDPTGPFFAVHEPAALPAQLEEGLPNPSPE
jgi:hypothetical protein